MMLTRMTVVMGLVFAAAPVAGLANDWPQFRGIDSTGVTDTRVPAQWGPDANVQWKVKIPGVAWSSPIVSGDKVFVTTAITENQQRPGGYGGPGGGGPPRRGGEPGGGGPGGPRGGGPPRFTPPRPGELLPAFFQRILNLSDEQTTALEQLQKEVDDRLAKLLTDEQAKQFQDTEPGGRGPGGRGRFAPPQPGQIIPQTAQDALDLTAEQIQQLETLQKDVDGKIASLLTDDQNQRLRDMRSGRGPGGRGGFGGGSPPDDVYRWEVYCIDRATGQTLWKQLALESKPRIPIQRSNTYATETPVTDGERVYVYFGMHGLFCYDFAGTLVWKKDLGSYPLAGGWGTASSPVLEGDRLFVLCDNEEESFLVALDKLTGDELWRVARTEQTTYATPIIWRNKVRTELVTLGSPKMRSYDPVTGKQLWELTIGNGQCSASPVGDAEMLYAGVRSRGGGPGPGGRGGDSTASGLFAVRAGASGNLDLEEGDSSAAGLAWNSPRSGPEMASPLVYQGHLYLLSQNGGIITCFDAKTGEQVYRSRLPGAKAFWSSPWAANGKVFCLDDGGTTYVVEAGPEFKLLSQNKLDEMFWASPAVAAGAVFLRSVDHLYCISN